jgi:hypothetical protein
MTRAVVVQRVARLPFPAEGGGASPTPRLQFTSATVAEVNPLLATDHYLGPIAGDLQSFAGWVDDELVACQVWRWPTARMLPSDGTMIELSRWCLTAEAGPNAGSRMMRWVRTQLRRLYPTVELGVSYSDPIHGHTGALYKASGWTYAPTHIGRRYDRDGIGYPSGNGSWDGVIRSTSKHRWLYQIQPSNNKQQHRRQRD